MKSVEINIDEKVLNDVYLPYLKNESRYLILYGGAGSGKSVFAAQRYLIRLMSPQKCNLLCVRAVGNTNRDSTFALFRQIISNWNLAQVFKINLSDLRIACKATGNSVLFKGLDDTEKLKSITFENGELTDVWVEEASEVSEADFNQLDVRLRGGNSRKQIVLTFNPIDINHWLKKKFFDAKPQNATVLHTTYKDNKFLDDDYEILLESYKNTDPYYYSVYCLGQWGVFGKTVFNAENIQARLDVVKNKEFVRGRFADSEFVEAEDGNIKIYEKPIMGVPYVIGADTAGEGSDFFAAHVIDNTNGKQVAVLHAKNIDETLFAQELFELGRYYNNALVGIEANFSTYPIKKFEEWDYQNQYVRESEDVFTHMPKKSFGFKTSSLTRPLIISGLVDVVREAPELISDEDTLLEMLTFVRNEKGRPEAQQGSHDDLVMSLAITYYIRTQQTYIAKTEDPRKKVEWDSTMYEDYYKATPSQQKYLLQKWGVPNDIMR